MNLAEKFKSKFPEVLFNEPLRKYSTFQIGGPADYFYHLNDTSLLHALIEFARRNDLSFFIIGAGSNILFHDQGFRGLVIKIESNHISHHDNENEHTIVADGGALISKLLEFSINEGLTGFERWTGLPGTVGGAVRGNAGCNGLETKDILINAVLYNPQNGQITIHPTEYFMYNYRESRLKPDHANYEPQIVLSASFRVSKRQVSAEEQQKQINEIRQVRLKAQPPGLTTGSFFKNPSPDKPAGQLIDLAGLKGHLIGHAQISPKHGNFFMNLQGKATSEEMLALSQLAQKTVLEKFGVHLEPEVVIVPSVIVAH